MNGADTWIDRQVSPSFLFATGLLLAPALILQRDLLIKALQTSLFLALALSSTQGGRKRLFIGSFVFMGTTVLVNLFSPVGRVLLEVGPFSVTGGALRLGAAKALTLAGLLYLSRLCVRPTVRLPGTVGRYVSQTFGYLNRLLAGRKRVGGGRTIQRLDALFDGILAEEARPPGATAAAGNGFWGLALLAVLLVLNWGVLLFQFSPLLDGP